MEQHVNHKDWFPIYTMAKDACAFADAVEFCTLNPGTVNNVSGGGCTLLHQAAFWGVDEGILNKFKALGSDPTLRDRQGQTPSDMARAHGRDATAEAIDSIFHNFEQDKCLLLSASRAGDLAQVMSILARQLPLLNIQGPTGWGILHQVAFHGAPTRVFRRLLALKADPDLRTHTGESYLEILRQHHPRHVHLLDPQMQGTVEGLTSGTRVVAMLPDGSITGRIQTIKVSGEVILVQDGSLQEHCCQAWRVEAFPTELQSTSPEQLADLSCTICASPVFGEWSLGASCIGDPHVMCGECTATWAWAKFTQQNFPVRCSTCREPCNLDAIPARTTRSMVAAWASLAPSFNTELSYDQFFQRLKERNTEALDENSKVRNAIDILRTCGVLDHAIAHCRISGTPACRACPQCRIPVYHISACKHMSCDACRARFCWLCVRTESNHNDTLHKWPMSHVCPVKSAQAQIHELEAILAAS